MGDRRGAAERLLELLDPDGVARAEEAALDRLDRSAHLAGTHRLVTAAI